jgi:hypothetical protein
MDELIKKKCEEYDLTPDLLTPQELAELKEEIAEEQKGNQVRDSILDKPELQQRRIKKELEEESK